MLAMMTSNIGQRQLSDPKNVKPLGTRHSGEPDPMMSACVLAKQMGMKSMVFAVFRHRSMDRHLHAIERRN